MSPSKTAKKKIFFLDTNVLISDPFAFNRMGEHNVSIPIAVVEECDKLKNRGDSVGVSARLIASNLDSFLGPDLYKDGVPLGPGKGKLSISIVKELHPEVKKMFKEDSPDNKILSAVMFAKDQISREENKKRNQKKKVIPTSVVFVSNDIDLRIKAGALGLEVEKYRNNSIEDVNSLYSGIQTINFNAKLVATIFSDGKVSYEKVRELLADHTPKPHPYEFFVIPDEEGRKTYSYFHDGYLYPVTMKEKVYGRVSAKNDEQRLALSLLLNSDIEMMTISGTAGTGKTLLAIGAAIQLFTKQEGSFKKVLITKPIVALSGRNTGALPGDKVDKVRPFMDSLYDNIDFLRDSCKDDEKTRIDRLVNDKEKFIVESLDYIRGRTFTNAILVVDESQNLTQMEVIALVTRMGKHSKIIFTGDIYQIDNTLVDPSNNGLTYLIEKSKSYEHSAHINLVKGERSALADWAAKNL